MDASRGAAGRTFPAAFATAPGTRALLTLVVLFLACAGSVAVAVANVAFFELVNRYVRATDEIPRGIAFSSWLLILALPFVVWRPAAFGLSLGSIRRRWRFVAATTIAAAFVTAALLKVVGGTPYSDASAFIEIVDVPITEELLFRGVFVPLLVGVLARIHPVALATALAVVIDGIAFGVGHAANALSLEPGFVAMQVAFATALGTACAVLMVRTKSVYPAMLLHGVVNGVVVFV